VGAEHYPDWGVAADPSCLRDGGWSLWPLIGGSYRLFSLQIVHFLFMSHAAILRIMPHCTARYIVLRFVLSAEVVGRLLSIIVSKQDKTTAVFSCEVVLSIVTLTIIPTSITVEQFCYGHS
jgi:hypothetical protein